MAWHVVDEAPRLVRPPEQPTRLSASMPGSVRKPGETRHTKNPRQLPTNA